MTFVTISITGLSEGQTGGRCGQFEGPAADVHRDLDGWGFAGHLDAAQAVELFRGAVEAVATVSDQGDCDVDGTAQAGARFDGELHAVGLPTEAVAAVLHAVLQDLGSRTCHPELREGRLAHRAGVTVELPDGLGQDGAPGTTGQEQQNYYRQ